MVIDPRESITEFTHATDAVDFSREAFEGTVPILAERQTGRETAPWTKSIETSVVPAV